MTRPFSAPDRIVVLSIFVVLATLASAPQVLARAPHCEDLKGSVVKIMVKGKTLDMGLSGVSLQDFEATGSGVLLDSHRHVLTAAHVVNIAQEIRMAGPSGDSSPARPIMIDRVVDIAVIELDSDLSGISPARLALKAPKPGDELWALGHPRNMDYSLSRGIVSAVRNLSDAGILGWNGHLIQTDAAMNPGVSGGGLFDSEGRLVGISASILTASGGSEGIGFGIDLEAIRDVLTASPCVWLGIDAVTVPPEVARAMGLPNPDAYLVQQVFSGEPADRAGLEPGTIPAVVGDTPMLLGGSIILKIDGYEECRKACKKLAEQGIQPSGHRLNLTVLMDGEVQTIEVTTQGPHVNWAEVLKAAAAETPSTASGGSKKEPTRQKRRNWRPYHKR